MDRSLRSTVMLRAALLVAGLAAALLAVQLSGARAHLSLAGVRSWMAGAGPTGMALFLVVFSAGLLIHTPGTVFVVAGVLSYGRVLGGVLGFVGAVLAVSVSFAVMRGVGGQPLAALDRPLFRRLLAHLEARPVQTVALARLVFWTSPPLNLALALSPIRFRDHLIGSASGLIAPIAFITLSVDWVASLLARA